MNKNPQQKIAALVFILAVMSIALPLVAQFFGRAILGEWPFSGEGLMAWITGGVIIAVLDLVAVALVSDDE